MPGESAKIVTPIITVGSVDGIESFYKDKLGFTRVMGVAGDDGRLNMVTMVLAGAKLIFALPREQADKTQPSTGRRPVEIYLEVADVDAYHAQLRSRNVPISDPLTLQWWGDKTFKVKDPCGYEVWFYQKVGQPKPPQGVKIV